MHVPSCDCDITFRPLAAGYAFSVFFCLSPVVGMAFSPDNFQNASIPISLNAGSWSAEMPLHSVVIRWNVILRVFRVKRSDNFVRRKSPFSPPVAHKFPHNILSTAIIALSDFNLGAEKK